MKAFLKTGKLSGPEATNPLTSRAKMPKIQAAPPWVEKYRPRTVEDVVEQKEVIEVLRQSMSSNDFPNLLFYGPPGSGKTSTILAAGKELFGSMYKDRILELNASDERGIQVIRDKVKCFAQLTASSITPEGKPCPPFKLVILDEADSMTNAAQSALRRTMEKESHSTRFCLICNYISRIIEPLTSRCTKFRFKSLSEEEIINRLLTISKKENLRIDNYTLTQLVKASDGDLRKAITSLQSAARLQGNNSEITISDITEVTGVIPETWVSQLLEECQSMDFSRVEAYVNTFLLEAYSIYQVIEQLSERIIYADNFVDKQKAFISEQLGECSYRLLQGGSEYIQLMNLSCSIMQANQLI